METELKTDLTATTNSENNQPTPKPARTDPKPLPTLADISENLHKNDPAPSNKNILLRQDMFSKFLIIEGPTHWLFRLGFASIFLINAVVAAIDPASFTNLLKETPVTNVIGHHDLMLKIAMINDLLLGVLIIGGWRKQIVYAWAGGWLLMVAGLKMMNLIFS